MTNSVNTRWWQDKSYTYTKSWAGWFVLTFWLTILVAFLAIIIPTVQAFSNSVDRTDCAKFGKASGLSTEFAYYGFWNNECFVVGQNGVRIPVDKMYNNVGN